MNKKSYKYYVAAALGLACVPTLQAATTVRITGSTAFRKGAMVGIENLLLAGPGGGTYNDGSAISAGKFKATFIGTTGANAEQSATYVVYQGTMAGLPVGANPVTIQVSWSGSVGGIATTQLAVPISNTNTGWLTAANITATNNECSAVGDTNILGITAGASLQDAASVPDGTFTDANQSTPAIGAVNMVGMGSSAAGKMGVIPFDWVVCNQVTAPVTFTLAAAPAGSHVLTYTAATYNATAAAATVAQAGAVTVAGGGGLPNRNEGITVNTGLSTITLAGADVTSAAIAAGDTITGAVPPVTNYVTNLTQINAKVMLSNGGLYLSQITGNVADNAKFVYAYGRNYDSGTRISCLSEVGLGIKGSVNVHAQPAFVGGPTYAAQTFSNGGAGGGANKYIATLTPWKAETLFATTLNLSFALGQSGYNGGGDLADALATPGSQGAVSGGGKGVALTYAGTSAGGIMIGYLGRSDAERACKTTAGANFAHHILWNGERDWNVATPASAAYVDSDFAISGAPVAGYNNANIQEGRYTAWEFEWAYKAAAAAGDANKNAVLDALGDRIASTDAAAAGLLTSGMHVSRATEGAVTLHQ